MDGRSRRGTLACSLFLSLSLTYTLFLADWFVFDGSLAWLGWARWHARTHTSLAYIIRLYPPPLFFFFRLLYGRFIITSRCLLKMALSITLVFNLLFTHSFTRFSFFLYLFLLFLSFIYLLTHSLTLFFHFLPTQPLSPFDPFYIYIYMNIRSGHVGMPSPFFFLFPLFLSHSQSFIHSFIHSFIFISTPSAS